MPVHNAPPLLGLLLYLIGAYGRRRVCDRPTTLNAGCSTNFGCISLLKTSARHAQFAAPWWGKREEEIQGARVLSRPQGWAGSARGLETTTPSNGSGCRQASVGRSPRKPRVPGNSETG
jgi:hypothetical protein